MAGNRKTSRCTHQYECASHMGTGDIFLRTVPSDHQHQQRLISHPTWVSWRGRRALIVPVVETHRPGRGYDNTIPGPSSQSEDAAKDGLVNNRAA